MRINVMAIIPLMLGIGMLYMGIFGTYRQVFQVLGVPGFAVAGEEPAPSHRKPPAKK